MESGITEHIWSPGTTGVNILMAATPARVLCPVPTPGGITMYTCTRCAWILRVENHHVIDAQAAFDAHCCEDLPRDEGE